MELTPTKPKGFIMSVATEKRQDLQTVIQFESPYVSPYLDDEQREELTAACQESHRTTYYNLTPEQVFLRNEWSKENFVFSLVTLDWETCVDRLGLVKQQVEEIYSEKDVPLMDDDGEPVMIGLEDANGDPVTDDDGEPILVHDVQRDDDGNPLRERVLDEDGNPEVVDRIMGEYRFKCAVSVEGLEDCNGEPIPKGKSVVFDCVKQPTNRPMNAANYTHLLPRFPKWGLNGETIIKDALGNGQSEQHRLVGRVVQILSGDVEPDDVSVQSFCIDGIHPDIAITIDTGKPNSGKDIFGSDPEIAPPEILLTASSYVPNKDGEIVHQHMEKRSEERTRVCGFTESSAKLILNRLGGKNVNASYPGGGNHATEVAHVFVSSVLPDLDDLCSLIHSFLQILDAKKRPCTVPELATAITLYQLREEDMVDTMHYNGVGPKTRQDVDWGTPMDDVRLHLDLDEVVPILTDIVAAPTGSGQLIEWSHTRLQKTQTDTKDKALKFAKLCHMVRKYFAGEELTKDDLLKGALGRHADQNAKNFWHFGGADRGPLPEKVKVEK